MLTRRDKSGEQKSVWRWLRVARDLLVKTGSYVR